MAFPTGLPRGVTSIDGLPLADVSTMSPEEKQRIWMALHGQDGGYAEPPWDPVMLQAAWESDDFRPQGAPSTMTLTAEAGDRRRAEKRNARAQPEVRLTSGPESRTEGAPNTQLPAYEDAVAAVTARMLEDAGLPNTPEYRNAMRADAEAYVNSQLRPAAAQTPSQAAPARPRPVESFDPSMPARAGGGVAPTPEWAEEKTQEIAAAILSRPGADTSAAGQAAARRAAENEVRAMSMGGTWAARRQAAGDPHRDFAEEWGGEVPDFRLPTPALPGTGPSNVASLSVDERRAYERMLADGDVTPGAGFGREGDLSAGEMEDIRWRAGTARRVREDNERYGPYWMKDADINAAAEANQPYQSPSDRESLDAARRLLVPGNTPGWSPPGAVLPRQPQPGVPGPMLPPPLETDAPGIPMPQAGAGPVAIDGDPLLPSLHNQVDSRLGALGPSAPMPGQTDPRYQFWKDERQGRRDREDRFFSSPQQREAKIKRMAARAGLSYEEAKALADQGRAALGDVDGPLTPAQRAAEFEGLRGKVNNAQLADAQARRQRRIDQAMLAGGQPTGGIGGSRAAYSQEMFQRDRTDDLLARLSQEGISDWERAGIISILAPRADTANPTPLGVDAVGAQNTMRMLNANAFADGGLFNNSLRGVQAANAEANLPLDVRADRERDANNGVLPASSPAGQAVLSEIATRIVGNSYATQDEYDRAVDAAVAQGVPRPEAEDYMRRHSQTANSGFWGWMLGSPPGIGSPAGAAAPVRPPVTPREARGE